MECGAAIDFTMQNASRPPQGPHNKQRRQKN